MLSSTSIIGVHSASSKYSIFSKFSVMQCNLGFGKILYSILKAFSNFTKCSPPKWGLIKSIPIIATRINFHNECNLVLALYGQLKFHQAFIPYVAITDYSSSSQSEGILSLANVPMDWNSQLKINEIEFQWAGSLKFHNMFSS